MRSMAEAKPFAVLRQREGTEASLFPDAIYAAAKMKKWAEPILIYIF